MVVILTPIVLRVVGIPGETETSKFLLWSSCTLPETNSEFAPENGWLEEDPFLLGWPIFRGELLVLGRVSFFGVKSVYPSFTQILFGRWKRSFG